MPRPIARSQHSFVGRALLLQVLHCERQSYGEERGFVLVYLASCRPLLTLPQSCSAWLSSQACPSGDWLELNHRRRIHQLASSKDTGRYTVNDGIIFIYHYYYYWHLRPSNSLPGYDRFTPQWTACQFQSAHRLVG